MLPHPVKNINSSQTCWRHDKSWTSTSIGQYHFLSHSLQTHGPYLPWNLQSYHILWKFALVYHLSSKKYPSLKLSQFGNEDIKNCKFLGFWALFITSYFKKGHLATDWLPLSMWHIPVTFKTVCQARFVTSTFYVKHCVCQQKWSINYWSMKYATCFYMQCHSDKWHRRWSFCFISHSFISSFYGLISWKFLK